MDFNIDKILVKAPELIVQYGSKLLVAIVILVIGLWLTKVLTHAFEKALDKNKTDPTLKPFLKGIVNTILKILVVITALSQLGIEMTSFVAILGAAGLAVGMALSGTLQNFAGGVMLLIFKPFGKGDLIEAQGFLGIVSEIQIFNTILKSLENKTVIIPNGGLSTGPMVNYSTEEKLRVDWTFGIAYGDDVDKARSVIKKLADLDPKILKDPEIFIEVSELGDSSVNFAVRAWAKGVDYWDVHFKMNEAVYKEFAKEGLSIPFPQMDVHINNV